MAVSVLGTLAVFSGWGAGLAGAFSSSGTGNVSALVGTQASISLKAQQVNFSTVQAGDTKDSTNCGSDAVTGQCFFTLENDGTVNLNVSANVTGQIWSGVSKVDSDYQIYGEQNESSSAILEAATGSKKNLTSNGVGANPLIFSSFNFTNGKDMVNVRIRVHVPADEPSGAKTSTITFGASQS